MRLSLPRQIDVFTSVTVTLKSFWTAFLISILLAVRATSKITLFSPSDSRVALSVMKMGRLMMFSLVRSMSLLRAGTEAASLEGLGGALRHDEVVVAEQVVDVDALRGEELVRLDVPDRLLELV